MKKKRLDPLRGLLRLLRQIHFLLREFPVYVRRLKGLDAGKTMLTHNSILILSGSGDYSRAALTPAQKSFLRKWTAEGKIPVSSNFPYHPAFPHRHYRKPGLLFASLSNIVYFWHTLYNPLFRSQLERFLSPLSKLSGCIVIAQSSGLNVLLAALKNQELSYPLTVFSLGTIARGSERKKNLTVYHIKGRRDPYCRLLDLHQAHFNPSCDHFGYIRSRQVLSYVRQVLKGERKDEG